MRKRLLLPSLYIFPLFYFEKKNNFQKERRRKVRKAFPFDSYPDCERIIISVTEGTWIYLKRHCRAMHVAKPVVYEDVWVWTGRHGRRCLRGGQGEELLSPVVRSVLAVLPVDVPKHHDQNQLKEERTYPDVGSTESLRNDGETWQWVAGTGSFLPPSLIYLEMSTEHLLTFNPHWSQGSGFQLRVRTSVPRRLCSDQFPHPVNGCDGEDWEGLRVWIPNQIPRYPVAGPGPHSEEPWDWSQIWAPSPTAYNLTAPRIKLSTGFRHLSISATPPLWHPWSTSANTPLFSHLSIFLPIPSLCAYNPCLDSIFFSLQFLSWEDSYASATVPLKFHLLHGPFTQPLRSAVPSFLPRLQFSAFFIPPLPCSL